MGWHPEADAEITAAEKAGFRLNPQPKEDVKKALAGALTRAVAN